jgi:hypothetical protein
MSIRPPALMGICTLFLLLTAAAQKRVELPAGKVGVTYRQILSPLTAMHVEDCTGDEPFPPGLTVTFEYDESVRQTHSRRVCVLTGTPSKAGQFSFTIHFKGWNERRTSEDQPATVTIR